MKTRRNFIKGLFGVAGCCLVAAKLKAAPRPRINKDFEAGMIATIQAGKGPRPTLGWKCIIRLNQHQRPLQGKIQTIDFKNRTITVHVDSLIIAEKAGRVQKPFGNKQG